MVLLVQVRLEVKMIKIQSIVRIVDNSGGKKARCIKIKGKSSTSVANLGDIVIVSIQSLRHGYRNKLRSRVNKSEIHRGVVVQTRRFSRYMDGRSIYFNRNSVVLISLKGNPLGTRILTFLPRSLRGLGWAKLGTIAKGFI